MSALEAVTLAVSAVVAAYLLYALLRGEEL
jgi:hypothetical protein